MVQVSSLQLTLLPRYIDMKNMAFSRKTQITLDPTTQIVLLLLCKVTLAY